MTSASSCRNRCGASGSRSFSRFRLAVVAVVVSPLPVILMLCSAANAETEFFNAFPTDEDCNSPHWDKDKEILFFVGANPGRLYRYNQRTFSTKIVDIEFYQEVSFIVPAKGIQGETHFAVGIGVEVAIVVWDTSVAYPVTTILNRANITEFRDDIVIAGKADAKGRLWVGTERGFVCTMDSVGFVKKRLSGVGLPRGFAWSVDSSKFYYADSKNSVIVESEFTLESGDVSPDGTVIFDFSAKNVTGTPKGITVDASGNVWVACFGTNQVVVIDPKTSTLLKTIGIPDSSNVTSVTFGGPNLDYIYVTTAKGGLIEVSGIDSTGLPGLPYDLITL